MQIETVTAHAFGPLAGQTLELAEGLTIVFGPNESAKSSWHAATYAALCGRPHHGGGLNQQFADRHRPWQGSTWLVSARVRLDDGRRIGLRQNLDNRAECEAVDLDLGRDCSAEIMRDKAPDASVWLGLDRASFRATACVAQTQILGVLSGSDGLRGHLQRAVAVAGDDQPVDAITRIRDFQAEAVGTTRSSTKPLARAQAELAAAQVALSAAQQGHEQYEQQLLVVEQTRAAVHEADRLVQREEWAVAAAVYDALAERARRSSALAKRRAELTAHVQASADVATRAESALHSWEQVAYLRVPDRANTPAPDPTTATATGDRPLSQPAWWMLFAGLGGAVVGAGTMLAGQPVFGVALLVLSLALAVVGALAARHRVVASAATPRDSVSPAEVVVISEPDVGAARASAAHRLAEVADQAGLAPANADDAAAGLRTWLAERAMLATKLDTAREEVAAVLGGLSPAELDRQVAAAAQRADRLRQNLGDDPYPLAPVSGSDHDAEERLARLRSEARSAAESARGAEVALAQVAAGATAVGDAEERLARAETELNRLNELADTLTRTQEFLQRAQERAHRTVAVRLKESLQGMVPVVTAGRYQEVGVDPETLAVTVISPTGQAQRAEHLSFGTAEQIYLMLRIALAEHLVADGVSCPLLFDDVTVHADAERTAAIMGLLLDAAKRHQIVVFTQQQQVREWARQHLAGDRHAIRDLVPVPVA